MKQPIIAISNDVNIDIFWVGAGAFLTAKTIQAKRDPATVPLPPWSGK
jgi:hypothetical protein